MIEQERRYFVLSPYVNTYAVGGNLGFNEVMEEENKDLYNLQLQKQEEFTNGTNNGNGVGWGAIINAAGTNIANAALDTNSSTADRVAHAMGIPALAKIWTADTSKGDANLKQMQYNIDILAKNNYIQDASSSYGANSAIKLNNKAIIPTVPMNNIKSLNWKDFRGNMFMNGLAATAQGAAAGSIGGPWGALGGAIVGLGSSLFGGIGARKRAKRAYADYQAKMGTLNSQANSMFKQAVTNQSLSNLQAFANGTQQQKINDMANIRAYGGGLNISPYNNYYPDGGELTDEQQKVLDNIKNNPRILFTPEYSAWRNYIRRTSPDDLDRLYESLPYEQQQDIYQNDREAWGALSNAAKGRYGAEGSRRAMNEAGKYTGAAMGLVGMAPAMEAVSMFPMLESGVNAYFGYEGAKDLPSSIYNTYNYAKEGDWSRAGLSAGEALLDGLFLKNGISSARNTAREVLPTIKDKVYETIPALDPYTSPWATFGYHGDNIPSRIWGSVARRFNYTPTPEIPEFHRRMRMNRPEDFRFTEDGKFIMSSGRTGEGHDNIINFATSEPARGHQHHKTLSGIDDFIVNPKALKDQKFISIEPSDTFFETGEFAVDPKDVTFVSGNPELLEYARSKGMSTLSSPKLREYYEANYGTSSKKVDNKKVGRFEISKEGENVSPYTVGKEIQRLTSKRGAPTLKDYERFEEETGLSSGTVPKTKETEEAYYKKVRGGKAEFNNVVYNAASPVEALYRDVKIDKKGALEKYSEYKAKLKEQQDKYRRNEIVNNNTKAMGGYIDLSPNMMNLWNNKQAIDQQKAMNQQFSLGLGNSFNQKMFRAGGPVDPPRYDINTTAVNNLPDTVNVQIDPYTQAMLNGITPSQYAIDATNAALEEKRAEANAVKNTAINMMYGDKYGEADYNNKYAEGGSVEYPDGTQYYANGGTHEENPYGGIQIGVDQQGNRNLAERGEFRWNDFIFSDRINVDANLLQSFNLPAATRHQSKKAQKGKLSYADMAKKYAKKHKELENDPASKNSFDAYMQRLANAQEYQKKVAELEAQKQNEMQNYKTALNQQYSNPMYGTMKYNGMGNAATQAGVNEGVGAGMGNAMANAELSNVNRSGNEMLCAYGGNMFWKGGYPVNPFRIPSPSVQNPIHVFNQNDWTNAHSGNFTRQGVTFDPYDLATNPPYQGQRYTDAQIANITDPTARQRILVNEGYDIGNSGPNGDGVDGVWGSKSKTAWDNFNLARRGYFSDGSLNLGIGTSQMPNGSSNADSQYTYRFDNANGDLDRIGLTDGITGTATNNVTGNVNTGDNTIIGKQTPNTNADAAIPPSLGNVPLYNTNGKYMQFAKGLTKLIDDDRNFTNVPYERDIRPALQLEALGQRGPFYRTVETIGGYRAPNLMDVERQNSAAQAQALAQMNGVNNISNGNRGYVSTHANQIGYNAGMNIGNNYATTQQYNDTNRFQTDQYNLGINATNAAAINQQHQDNQKAEQVQNQQAIAAKQASNDYIQKENFYADKTNAERAQNRADNLAAWSDNAANFFTTQAMENQELNTLNNDPTNPYYIDKNGVTHYVGDNGLTALVQSRFKDGNGTFTGDRLTEWNNLTKRYKAKDLYNHPEFWEHLVKAQEVANATDAQNAKLAQEAEHKALMGSYRDNVQRLNDLRALGVDISDDLYNRYNDWASEDYADNWGLLRDRNRYLDDFIKNRYNAYDKYLYEQKLLNAKKSAYGGHINNPNKYNGNYYSYMSI